MATATSINLKAGLKPDFAVQHVDHSALETARQSLQRNHDETNIFFNNLGFHNHTAHFTLNLWALGANAKVIEDQFKTDMAMQKPLAPADASVVASFEDVDTFIQGLAKPGNYSNYLAFFHKQLASKPWQTVVHEFIFKNDERASIMFHRLYSSIVHPWIHLALGIEFSQPAIIAEALAQTAVHEAWLDVFFEHAEALAAANAPPPPASMLHLLHALHTDPAIKNAPRASDRPPKRHGIIGRALPEMARYAAQWRVDEAHLQEAVAELTNAAMYTMGGAQMPGHAPKMDFALMHSVTSTIGLATFLRQDWLSGADKVRLVEGKGRADLIEYAAAGSPALYLDRIQGYAVTRDWEAIAAMVVQKREDGHAAKMIRAIMHAEKVCAPYEAGERFAIKGDMWLKLGNMAIDSVSDGGPYWIFGAGFPESWGNARVSYA